LTVSRAVDHCIVPVVTSFLAKFPQINIYLTLSDHMLDMVDEHVDLAIRTGMLSDSTLVATKLGEIRRVVCGSPAYFSTHGTPKTLDDLAKHMCVTYTALASGMTWIFNPRDGKPSRLAIRRQIFFCPMRMDDFIRPNTFAGGGPLVVSFYRGGWCPFCNAELRALQAVKVDFDSLKANLVVLSPETRDLPRQLKRQLNLDLTMLADCPIQRLNAA
jgi:thiol-disulfide isomerase/thioredoxin